MTEQILHLDIPSLGSEPISLDSKKRWVLGSDPHRVDLILHGQEVAPVHCVLEVQGSHLQVTDLGSETGTLVDGTAITIATLGPGQRLDVGPVSIWLSDGNSASYRALPTIPGYEVDREVGRGAGGHVYLATQTSLQRQVAIKVLAPGLSHDAEVVQRFESEARAAAALGHPNVVTVFDVGSAGSVHYLSMEYMAEGSLADRLERRGPLSWRQTLRMMSDAAKALAFAESRALVHRDIKPANLMLTDTGVTKLADLGLVLDLSKEQAGGPAMGTPHFLAPEVIQGQTPSPQSDLYSLGATAYQVATGKTPFQGSSTKEILRSALTEAPQAPCTLDEEIPLPVSQLIMDLMTKDPALRPQAAQEVLERIDRLDLALGLPETSKPGSARRKVLLLAGPAILVASYFAWDLSKPAPPQPLSGQGDGQGANSQGAASLDAQDGDQGFSFSDVKEDPGSNPAGSNLGQEFETQAQERFKALQELDLSDEVRIQRLRKFAQEFRGSNSADSALTLAGTLEERARSTQRAMEQASQALAEEIALLTGLARWSPGDTPLDKVLKVVLEYQPSLEGQGLADFQEERSRVLRSLYAQGDAQLQNTLAGARSLAGLGEFSEAKEQLTAQTTGFAPVLELDLTLLSNQGQLPDEMLNFQARLQEMSALLNDLPRLAGEWSVKTRAQDRITLGNLLGRSSGLRQELALLNFKAARLRLKNSLEQMRSEPGRGWVAAIDQDLANCQAYLLTWRKSFKAGQWRDTQTLDPRSSRPNNVPVTSVSTDWVSLDGVRVPLAEFVGKERRFRTLFEGRIQSPMTPQELDGLASLYRIRAVLAVLDHVQEMLTQDEGARFTEGEVADVIEELAKASAGQTEAGQIALTIETQTAQALVLGLQAYSSKDYGAAAGYMERAFEVGRGSLLLLLLSDGSALPLPGDPAPAPDVEGAEAEPSEETSTRKS